MKVGYNNYIRRIVNANIIDSDKVDFLCGYQTLVKWNTSIMMAKKKLNFFGINKSTKLYINGRTYDSNTRKSE